MVLLTAEGNVDNPPVAFSASYGHNVPGVFTSPPGIPNNTDPTLVTEVISTDQGGALALAFDRSNIIKYGYYCYNSNCSNYFALKFAMPTKLDWNLLPEP